MGKQVINVSIIVPVYNCEKYLNACVSSLLLQTEKDIEVILVNDGSTDNSGNICERFRLDFDNVNVIHQRNQGVSKARNTGMQIANGKYTTFVDSDDYVDKEYIEKLLSVAQSNNYDLVSCGGTFVNGSKIHVVNCLSGLNGSREELMSAIVDSGSGGAIFGKLVRTSLLKESSIQFNQEYSFREDLLFWLELSNYITSYTNIEYFGYYYRLVDNEQSLSKKNDVRAYANQLKLTDVIENLLEKQINSKATVNKIVGRNVTKVVISTILKQIRSGSCTVSSIKEIIRHKNFVKYKGYIKINRLKDIIFVFPIKYNMPIVTYLIFKFRFFYLKRERLNK